MNWTQPFLILAYLVFFMGSIAAMIWWAKRQRKTRLPFGDELKLQRGPGETQLALVRKFDEEGFMWMVCAATAPATVVLVLLVGALKLPKELQLAGVAVTLMAFIAVFIWSARWFARKAQESSNRYLGYFGERLVAEYLEPLKAQGWRIFHDVPALNNGQQFNLDHVAVGPTGVFAIETKTRRKGAARPGFDDHKVYFDGHALVWPWGEDSHGLDQTERNAAWLAETLAAETGERVPVIPILTLPGWWVEMKPAQDPRVCRVTNPKGLAKFLPAGKVALSEAQIASVAGKLEVRCRDVEY